MENLTVKDLEKILIGAKLSQFTNHDFIFKKEKVGEEVMVELTIKEEGIEYSSVLKALSKTEHDACTWILHNIISAGVSSLQKSTKETFEKWQR